jgi:hypothetical protein
MKFPVNFLLCPLSESHLRTHLQFGTFFSGILSICFSNREINHVLVLLENLIVTQLVKKFPAFCGTHRFITVLTRS